MSGFLTNVFRFASQSIHQQVIGFRQFHALPISASGGVTTPPLANPWSLDSVRTIIRNNFPKARERKRVKTLGWKARLSTKSGRRLIMRRILKGRYCLTH